MKHTRNITIIFLIIFLIASVAHAAEKPEFPRRNAVVKVVEKVRASVVNISTERIVVASSPWDRLFPFDDYYRTYKTNSLGSGVILDEDGYIITNAHVVKRAKSIKVRLADKEEYEARLISIHQDSDLALLKIEPKKKLKAITLGTSRDLMIGETAIAMGNPFGLSNTVTVGVISATNRSIHVRGKVIFKDFLQTDAAINPGNSGGPLVNINGKLIGINTAIHAGANGIGFAIPVDRMRAVLKELVSPGRLADVYMGFALNDVSGEPVVAGLAVDGPAEKAGVCVGDAIVSVEGGEAHTFLDLAKHIIDKKPGDKLELTIRRGSEKKRISITLAAMPETEGQKLTKKRLGLTLRRLPAHKAVERGLGFKGRVVVEDVEKGGPGSRIGIKKDDILLNLAVVEESHGYDIVYLNQPVNSYDDIKRFLSADVVPAKQSVRVTILRGASEYKGRMVIR
jgi:serine protease Do